MQGGTNFVVTGGTMTVKSDGTINGTLVDPFTGKITVGSKGAINASINSGGGKQNFTFYLNAAKDTMTEVESENDTNNNEQQIVVAHRVPAN